MKHFQNIFRANDDFLSTYQKVYTRGFPNENVDECAILDNNLLFTILLLLLITNTHTHTHKRKEYKVLSVHMIYS